MKNKKRGFFGTENDGKGWYVKLRDENNDYYFDLDDILTNKDYVEKLNYSKRQQLRSLFLSNRKKRQSHE